MISFFESGFCAEFKNAIRFYLSHQSIIWYWYFWQKLQYSCSRDTLFIEQPYLNAMNLNTIECQFTSENLCILDTQRGILDTQILISELHKLCKQKHISVWYIYTNTSKNVKLCIKTWIFLWCFKKFSCWVSWGRINLIWCASPSVSHNILPFLKSWWKCPSLTSIRFFKKNVCSE